MTVSAQTPINRSTGNGVTTVFPYTFKIISSADMEVSVDGVVKTLTVDYTLSGVGDDAGGNVTMLVAPASGASVVRRRNMALVRNTDYQDQGELPASTLDSDLDSAVLMIQQVDEKTDRAMVLPTYVSGFSTELPTPIASYFLRVNSAGTALELASEITPGALTVTPFIETLLNDSMQADARTTLGAAASGANTDITSLGAVASINGGALAGFRNRIINGNFGVNQRAYVSGAAVGAGLYGHDRWKMAASGDTYTFSTTTNVTTVTIPASKVLQQVIEGLNLETGTYTLSWTGTAQGKIGAGSYGASGITGAITGGTNTTIEFGPGTVSKVQLEFGSVATPFEQRPYGLELSLCQRHYQKYIASFFGGYTATASPFYFFAPLSVVMRSTPSVTFQNIAYSNASGIAVNLASTSLIRLIQSMTVTGYGYSTFDLVLDAEL